MFNVSFNLLDFSINSWTIKQPLINFWLKIFLNASILRSHKNLSKALSLKLSPNGSAWLAKIRKHHCWLSSAPFYISLALDSTFFSESEWGRPNLNIRKEQVVGVVYSLLGVSLQKLGSIPPYIYPHCQQEVSSSL